MTKKPYDRSIDIDIQLGAADDALAGAVALIVEGTAEGEYRSQMAADIAGARAILRDVRLTEEDTRRTIRASWHRRGDDAA